MDKKQLIKCNKALRKIEKLDSEIINIEKITMLVSNGEFESSFELKIRDLSRKDRKQQESLFDGDGSLNFDNTPYGLLASLSKLYGCSSYQLQAKKEEKFDFTLKPTLSESSILRILGILLAELQYERESLLNELQRHGIKI
jgi:hypothetical protein